MSAAGGAGTNGQHDNKKSKIHLMVKSQDGNEIFFKMQRNTPLLRLMNAYCNRQSLPLNSIVFLFDGRRLRPEQTPDQLEMEDGDEIDAMQHQTGGWRTTIIKFD